LSSFFFAFLFFPLKDRNMKSFFPLQLAPDHAVQASKACRFLFKALSNYLLLGFFMLTLEVKNCSNLHTSLMHGRCVCLWKRININSLCCGERNARIKTSSNYIPFLSCVFLPFFFPFCAVAASRTHKP